MSTTQESPTVVETNEKPTTHSRKAQITTIALIVLVVLGLIINAFASFNKRQKRDQQKDAADLKTETAAQPRPEAKLSDFAAKQQEAAGQITAQEKANAEKKRKDVLLDTFKGDGATDGASAAPKVKRTAADVADDFALDERKRVLDAMHGKIARVNGGAAAGAAAAPQSELAKVDQRIAALTAAPDAIAARQREVIERARAAGVTIPESVLARYAGAGAGATGAAGGATPAPVRAQQTTATGASFGELATNRVGRDPANSGPLPGEKILPTGTIVSANLDMDMMSDYTGDWIAVVPRPVYDVELENILIPAGTKIVGKSIRATGVNESIQNRMAVIPLWAIRPDGKRIDFKRTSGMDAAGVGALKDSVDRHFLAQFMGVGAYAIIGLGPSTSSYGAEPNSSRDSFIREATGRSRDIGRTFAEKFLNVVPTVTIHHGKSMKIFIQDDIYIKPWEEIDEAHFINP